MLIAYPQHVEEYATQNISATLLSAEPTATARFV